MNNRTKVILIVLIAATLRLWSLGSIGLQSDAAINAYRSAGWYDYLSGEGQTSPLMWYGTIPWWSLLSFHDHPPLVFLIQKISFIFFGESAFAALLPFAVAGIVTTYLIYAMVARSRSEWEALLASGLYAIASYAVWGSRTGYLEGVEVVFIVGSILFMQRLLTEDRPRNVYYWALLTGLALLSKYTAAFLIPAALISILLLKRTLITTKHFWLSCVIIAALLSPILVYNGMVFATRGHFDAALSSFLNIESEDFAALAGRNERQGMIPQVIGVGTTLVRNTSLGLAIAFGVAVLMLIYRAFRRSLDAYQKTLLIYLISGLAMFAFLGGAVRFASILVPLLVLGVATMVSDLRKYLTAHGPKRIQQVLLLIGMTVLVHESVFSLNTNILTTPFGSTLLYSPDRQYDKGFEEFDDFLHASILPTMPYQRRPRSELSQTVFPIEVKDQQFAIVDSRIDWFSRMWYVRRYQTYYGSNIMTFEELDRILRKSLGITDGQLGALNEAGAQGYWMIIGENLPEAALEKSDYNDSVLAMVAELERNGIGPSKEIRNAFGDVVLKIYHFTITSPESS